MARQTEKKLECVLQKADGDLLEAMCKRCGFTPQDYFAFCVDKAITAPADTGKEKKKEEREEKEKEPKRKRRERRNKEEKLTLFAYQAAAVLG